MSGPGSKYRIGYVDDYACHRRVVVFATWPAPAGAHPERPSNWRPEGVLIEWSEGRELLLKPKEARLLGAFLQDAADKAESVNR